MKKTLYVSDLDGTLLRRDQTISPFTAETIRIAKEQGKGVVALRGKMIDAPIVARAQQVVEMEKAMFGGAENE